MYLTMINTLRRRRDIPEQLFYDYWRDTHVSVAARIPGIDTLWTHWVSFENGSLWPTISGIDGKLAETEWFDGVPEPSFANEASLADFVAAMGPLMADEPNIFEKTISYRSMGDNTATVKDLLPRAPNGSHSSVKYMLFIRRRADVFSRDFQQAVPPLMSALAAADSVVKLRYHLLEEYENSAVVLDSRSGSVSHQLEQQNQHQAVVEIAFSDANSYQEFIESETWVRSEPLQQSLFGAVHPALVTRTYTWLLDGRPTLATVRGSAVVEQIRQLNSLNQIDRSTLDLFGCEEIGDFQISESLSDVKPAFAPGHVS